MNALFQPDLFASAVIARPAPAASSRRTCCPIAVSDLPPPQRAFRPIVELDELEGPTGDLPTLVHDGIKHLTYHVQ